MAKLKNKSIEKLNDVFNQFFVELGYPEIDCIFSNEFVYYPESEEISYTLLEMPLNDIGFKTYVRETYPHAPECSVMVLSLLHELGHHLTMDSISKNKMRKCKKAKKEIAERYITTDKELIQAQIDYCGLYDEKKATEKAIEILINNYDYILSFEEVWFNAVMKFYKENNVTFA